jgi:phage anti-repressor protein
MKNLKIHSHKILVNAIDARELWKELEIKSDFSDWIKGRISEYDYKEEVDYFSVTSKKRSATFNNLPIKRIDYFISIDMGKELAMVEKNEKGRQARRYFIECERQLKEKLLSNPRIDAMRRLLLLDSPSEWVKRFPDDFYIAIMRLHNQAFDGNNSTPLYCANITRRWIYDIIIPVELMKEIDEKRRAEKIHQWMTEGAGTLRLSEQIGKITMIAMMCQDRKEFELKCGVLFKGEPVQINLVAFK